MERTNPTAILLDCLQTRDLAAKYAELRKSLDREQDPSVESWINEYLGPETLLTKYELALYSALEESGDAQTLSSSQDLSLRKDLHEQEVLKAVEDLQRSTTAIEKQTESLRILQESTESMISSERRQRKSRESAQATQHRAWVAESTQIRSTVDEMSRDLSYQITDLESRCNNVDAKMRDGASEMLRLDNKYLAGLQKLANGLVLGEPDEEGAVHQIRNLCARLIKHVVESVRTRLDRVYLEALGGASVGQNGASSERGSDVDALQSELESLYTEILPVAQMSAEQQYLEPTLRLSASQDTQESERTEKALDYMSNFITVLIDQIQVFANCTEEYQAYRTTLHGMINAVKAELDSNSLLSPKVIPDSPSRLRRPPKTISPIRPRAQRRRSSATSLDEDSAPELQLLRNLGISLPAVQNGDGTLAASLQAALEDRKIKLNAYSKSLQEASEMSISSHLYDAQVTSAMLKRSLLSETQYKTVRLLDSDIQEAVGMLESDVENLKKDVGGVKLDVLRERNVRRDELIARWER